MLSDCVIALKPSNDALVFKLRDTLEQHFDQILSHYSGTGAPFITINRLRSVLESIGVQVAS